MELKAAGKLENFDYDKTYIHSISYCDEAVGPRLLNRALRAAYLRFYLRPGILFNLIGQVRSFDQIRNILSRAAKILFQKSLRQAAR